MAIFSKYMKHAVERYEELGFSKIAVSHALVGAAIFAYTVTITYPLLYKNQQNNAERTLIPKKGGKSQSNYAIDLSSNYNVQQNDYDSNSSKRKQRKSSDDELIPASNCSAQPDYSDDELKLAEAEKLLVAQQLKKKENHQIQPGINKEFLKQLRKLVQIMIPAPLCYETRLLGVHTLCLISRTFLSIYVATLEGALVKFIVRNDFKQFAIVLLKWFGIAVPATFINSMIRFLESKLSLAFRTRLVRHSYRLYFKNQNYYRVSNLDGRIENADHRLTEDISVFASSIAHLYSSLTKPCFDLMLIGFALMRSSKSMQGSSFSGPVLAVAVVTLTTHIMRIISPKFGQLVSEEANRYGYLRHIHSRIITNAEEIAFYGGHKVELQQLCQAYNRLVNQMNKIFAQKLWFVMLEQFFMKYVWSGTGMIMVSLPILASAANDRKSMVNNSDSNVSNRTQYLTTARNLLISAGDAIERLMSSYKEIVALAGYTYRVAGMMEVFEETAQGIYIKTTVDAETSSELTNLIEFKEGKPIAKGKIIYTDDPNNVSISLHAVPVVTPNCDVVVPSITISIEPGMHLLITGPNGCGKSSLFRILSGLWPIFAGELHIPRPVEGKPCMFYIPQRPYMSIGSLCDQIIYPDSREDMKRKGISEAKLKAILKMVSLEHIAQRDSFYGVRDWKDILSGGEKQRMAIARLFYHKPKYALLDECTSAVSIDVESDIYAIAKNMGITLLTITHRPTLWKFHTHILEFDGQGGWSFRPMEQEQQQ